MCAVLSDQSSGYILQLKVEHLPRAHAEDTSEERCLGTTASSCLLSRFDYAGGLPSFPSNTVSSNASSQPLQIWCCTALARLQCNRGLLRDHQTLPAIRQTHTILRPGNIQPYNRAGGAAKMCVQSATCLPKSETS